MNVLAIVCAAVGVGEPAVREFTFASAKGLTHPAVLRVPEERNGASVLLIGGGAAWDEHWTVPGSMTIEGTTTQVTIDGRDTRDADTLASALAARGFIVMQWSSIDASDDKAKENPALVMGIPFPESVELTRAALAALRAQPEVDAKRVVLVGHSLGATRACQVADEGVVAMVFLSGAYLSGTDRPPRELSAEALEECAGLDADTSGTVTRGEFDAWRPAAGDSARLIPSFEAVDKDRDGVLRGWEVAASAWKVRESEGDKGLAPKKPTLGGGPWPREVLVRTRMPVLALYGGLDAMSFHGAWLEGLRAEVDVEYFAGLGHQMGREAEGKLGPMDTRVVERVAGWVEERAGR